MFYFRTISSQPFPLPVIGCVVQRHEELLKRIAFEASRMPAAEAHAHTRSVIHSKLLAHMNHSLRRRGVHIVEMWMSFRRHHAVHFRYHTFGNPEASLVFSVVLYEPSKKAQTIERMKMEADASYDPDSVSYAKRGPPQPKSRRPSSSDGRPIRRSRSAEPAGLQHQC